MDREMLDRGGTPRLGVVGRGVATDHLQQLVGPTAAPATEAAGVPATSAV